MKGTALLNRAVLPSPDDAVLSARKYKVVLADTDVDAPNLHLVLGARLKKSEDIARSDICISLL